MYNMLQQPTCPLLLIERTLHVSMVQLCGVTHYSWYRENSSQSIKFVKKSQTIMSYISNSAF